MDEQRLPAAVEASALIRRAQAGGGFAMVLKKGDPDGGTILIVLLDNQGLGRLYERMPQLDGSRKWSCSKEQDIENKSDFEDYLARRGKQDPDLWIIELTVAEGERFILNGS
ncbi:DUF1491 family protein [Novosphingobium sp. KCTC 2891]|uniref:DUF1491 family protein n=1 Tax=Novosphingobium sp. KCTC 2891 TaxID=2989730 RepID=UPI0022230905|nr:DUF1491 family protein [Novosphingobium sp. KCTC 2891]MCW1382269.1 DUF1491 family protein [Novosphingobium sp. KCTC 2891]